MRPKKLQLSALFLLGFSLTGIYAQEATSASGGGASGTGGSASYSVGQVACSSYTGSTASVAQGVQQAYEKSGGSFIWNGATSIDYSIFTNWTPNIVPVSGTSITIPGGLMNYPTLTGDAGVGSMSIANGANLTINPASLMTVDGSITNSAGVSGIKILSSPLAANGSLVFHNAVGSPVLASVDMYSKASWNLLTAAGNKLDWQFFGIPVRTTLVEPTLSGSVVRESVESGTSSATRWLPMSAASELTSFKGYEIVQAAAKTVTFSGELENGDKTRTLTYTSGASYPGQHLIGNPYTAAIDIKQLSFGGSAEATVYLYNTGSLNDWTTNGSGAINGTAQGQYTAAPKSTAGVGGIPAQIPSMQAFLVKAQSAASATLDIPYSSVAVKNTDKQRTRAMDKVYSIIDVKGSRTVDRMWLFSDPICTRAFDNGWDGRKLLGSPLAPQLYAMEADGDYQINAVDDVNNTLLGFQTGEDTHYTLTFTHNNIASRYTTLYLVDLLKNTTTDISASGSEYSFDAQPSATPVKRFKIVTSPDATTNLTVAQQTLRVFCSNKTIFVHNLTDLQGDLYLYDIAGGFIQKLPFGANGISTLSVKLIPGAYVAKAKTASLELTEKIIIR